MKSSLVLAACGAVLAAASPIIQGRRLIVHSKVVTEWVTVTVTEGETPTPAVFSVARRPAQRTTTTTIATTTSAAPPPPPPPPPAPTTSAAPEPVVVVEPAPQPEPTTQAPPPVVESPAPVVKAPAPVVEAPAPVVEAPAPVETTQAPKVETPAGSDDYQKAVLESHNVHRFNHSAGALEWGQQYADSARVLAERCKFEHDTSINGGGYGQNLAMWAASKDVDKVLLPGAAARAISNGWYNNELELFPVGEYGRANPSPQAQVTFKDWGHFTQLVWKDSKQVGCFTAKCPAGTIVPTMESLYTVCNYFPVGNMGGAYGKNVLPPLGQPISMAA
ncbi:CAP domain-containing protein [Triangularia verruculosa]|uniref:CAP domain-containing protein n=1 Tax=Triangularia verruculosa TaxID=2587418 RepID=A0AAN7ARZ0_9PEZI|nr:CAP domain-containing protein [Triangularia verruculosa]